MQSKKEIFKVLVCFNTASLDMQTRRAVASWKRFCVSFYFFSLDRSLFFQKLFEKKIENGSDISVLKNTTSPQLVAETSEKLLVVAQQRYY